MRISASRGPVHRTLAIVTIALIAATGFCLFDGDDHDAVGLDLCTSILAAAMGMIAVIALGLAGSTTVRLGWAATPVSLAIPDPPPWRGPFRRTR